MRPRRLPDDIELAHRFRTDKVSDLADEYECSLSTLYYHKRRIDKAGDCWVCGLPMVGHSPSDHPEVPDRCGECGRAL